MFIACVIVPYFAELKEKGLIPKEVYEKITWKNAFRLLGLEQVKGVASSA